MTTDTEPSQTQRRDFLWNIQTSTNSYVQFADTKANFCVAITSAFVVALLTGKAQLVFLPSGPKSGLGLMSLGAFLFLGISLLAALTVVWPRPWKSSENRFVFWGGIARGFKDKPFPAQFEAQTSADLTRHLAHEVYDLATVCQRKYLWIDVATGTAAIGVILAILTLLWNGLPL